MLEIKKTNAKQLQTKKKHLDVKYVDSDQAKELINDKRFKAVNEIKENLYEIEMMKRRIQGVRG